MKISILVILLFTSCGLPTKKPKPKPNVSKQDKIMSCVDRYVTKDVSAEVAFKECKDLFRR